MNGDGLADLVTTNEGSVSILLGSGNGGFNSQSTIVDPSRPG